MNEEVSAVGLNSGIQPDLHIWGMEVAVYLYLGGLAAGLMILGLVLGVGSPGLVAGGALSIAGAVAVVFLVYGSLVSVCDQFLKPLLLGRGVAVPMLVILVGAIGGMMTAGVIGLFLGAGLPFLFAALTIDAVGRAANAMIEEVRRQFREKPGIMEGTTKPEYGKCVDLVTQAALSEMIKPDPPTTRIRPLPVSAMNSTPSSSTKRQLTRIVTMHGQSQPNGKIKANGHLRQTSSYKPVARSKSAPSSNGPTRTACQLSRGVAVPA